MYKLNMYTQIVAAKSLQSCPTLCNPIDSSLLGSSVLGILQARILKWVAISFSIAWKWKVKVNSLSRARLLATPWTQPTRLLHPWDSPGKNIGVGCHFLLQCMEVKSESEVTVMSDTATPWTAAHQAPPSMRFFRQEYWSECYFNLNFTDEEIVSLSS